MAEPEEEAEEEPKKRSKKPLMIGLVLALVLGGGGFFAVFSGMILAPAMHMEEDAMESDASLPLPDVVFIPIPPMVVNLGAAGSTKFLRFRAQLEVRKGAEEEVTKILPRVVDVLNGYLRAVETKDLEHRTALVRLRAQMLRRIQVVTGEGRVRDLLIMEFVLN